MILVHRSLEDFQDLPYDGSERGSGLQKWIFSCFHYRNCTELKKNSTLGGRSPETFLGQVKAPNNTSPASQGGALSSMSRTGTPHSEEPLFYEKGATVWPFP
jgi:hypothetical protein